MHAHRWRRRRRVSGRRRLGGLCSRSRSSSSLDHERDDGRPPPPTRRRPTGPADVASGVTPDMAPSGEATRTSHAAEVPSPPPTAAAASAAAASAAAIARQRSTTMAAAVVNALNFAAQKRARATKYRGPLMVPQWRRSPSRRTASCSMRPPGDALDRPQRRRRARRWPRPVHVSASLQPQITLAPRCPTRWGWAVSRSRRYSVAARPMAPSPRRCFASVVNAAATGRPRSTHVVDDGLPQQPSSSEVIRAAVRPQLTVEAPASAR